MYSGIPPDIASGQTEFRHSWLDPIDARISRKCEQSEWDVTAITKQASAHPIHFAGLDPGAGISNHNASDESIACGIPGDNSGQTFKITQI